MQSVDNKVNKFSSTIYKKATREKEDILNKAKKHREKSLKEKELYYLEKAYLNIQDSIRDIDKQKSELISKAYMNQKKSLLNRREEITDEVFKLALDKLRAYTESQEYKDYLIRLINEDLSQIGEGDVTIYISQHDDKYLNELNDHFNDIVSLYEGKDDFLGGCILENKTNKQYINDTLLKHLDSKHSKFIEISELVLE